MTSGVSMYTGYRLTDSVLMGWRNEMMKVIRAVEKCGGLEAGTVMRDTRQRDECLRYRQYVQYLLTEIYGYYQVRKAFASDKHWNRATITHSIKTIRNLRETSRIDREWYERLDVCIRIGLEQEKLFVWTGSKFVRYGKNVK